MYVCILKNVDYKTIDYVFSSVVPFTLGVVTNDNEKTTEMNRGCKLIYRQLLY